MGRVYEDVNAVYDGTQESNSSSLDRYFLDPEANEEDALYDEEEDNIRARPMTAEDAVKYGITDAGYNEKDFFNPVRIPMNPEVKERLSSLIKMVKKCPDDQAIEGRLKEEIVNFPFISGKGHNQAYDQMGEYDCWDLFRECFMKEPAVSIIGKDGKKLKGDNRPFSKPVATFIAWRMMLPKIIKDFTQSYLPRADVSDSYADFPSYYDEAFIVIHREIGEWNPASNVPFPAYISTRLKNISKVYGRENKSVSDYIRKQYQFTNVSWNALTDNIEKGTDDSLDFSQPASEIGMDPIEKLIQKEQELIKKVGMDVLVYICGMNISEHNNFALDVTKKQKKQLWDVNEAKLSDSERQKCIRQILEETPENMKDVPEDATFILKTSISVDPMSKAKIKNVSVGIQPSREQVVRMSIFNHLYADERPQWKMDLLDRMKEAVAERGVQAENLKYCLEQIMQELREEEEEYGDYDLQLD